MPNGRYRTISTGSTGNNSFTPCSSFSSSFSGQMSNQSPMFQRKLSLQSTLNSSPLISSRDLKHLSTSLTGLHISDEKLASSGNMFNTRQDWSILTQVPIHKQNAIHIRLDDEGPYGNDETRCFLLSYFSTLGIRAMSCVLCKYKEFFFKEIFFLTPRPRHWNPKFVGLRPKPKIFEFRGSPK